ncbi:transmembrane protein 225 [Suncus etruscus]|uniref:transmembrane protein 225 n=1 Tax=Suncus etruscus TaxID=109475 RepID=UPI002110C448|nr:transmembrane protein 225 [Suncus etruscus]
MENLEHRNIHAINLFLSSWILITVTIGMVVEDWIYLKTENEVVSHSPWKRCLDLFQEDDTEHVRIMMVTILILSFFQNFFLGLKFTYMISQKEHSCFISIALSFFTGVFLLITFLVYHYNIKQGCKRFYINYKITWITFMNYLNVPFLLLSGILSLLLYSSNSPFQNIIHLPSRRKVSETQSRDSGNVTSPATQTMPRSIVHRHSEDQDRPPEHKHRVTWALD